MYKKILLLGSQHAVNQLSQRHHLSLLIKLNSTAKYTKCLKIVFKCFSACKAQIILKCEWYKCAYTRNNLAAIFFTRFLKSDGNASPCFFGNIFSSSTCF